MKYSERMVRMNSEFYQEIYKVHKDDLKQFLI